MTGDEESEVVLNNNSSCTQISSNSNSSALVVTLQKSQKTRKDEPGSNGSSLSSEEGRQLQLGAGVGQGGRSTELVSEVSSVSGEPLASSVGHPSTKNSVFSENDADVISTTALSNSPSVDSNSEVFISGASTSALCGNGEGGGAPGDIINNGATPTGQLSDAQVQEDPDHVILSESDLASANLDQMVTVYHQLQNYIHKLKGDQQGLKDSEEKLRLQQNEVSRRENILVMRLATKDQEIHDYAAQINELKNSMAPSTSSLKNSLLDPAVNFIIQKMKRELTETKKKLEDTQNDLNAWKFTADSNTGKRLMAKCRMLYQENEDLGKMITSGRLAKLESDLALQKSLTEEMKKAQSEMDDLVQELDEDVEGMQSTIFFLQQQLREKINNNVTNSTSSQSSEQLVTVNTTELCTQCRAAQEKKHLLNHANCSEEGAVVKMEVDNSIDHEENSRTQDSTNSFENERTLTQNGESDVYSPNCDEQVDQTSSKLSEKRTTRATRHSQFSKQPPQSVNLNAESTYDSSNKLDVSNSVHDGESNSTSSKVKSNIVSLQIPNVAIAVAAGPVKGSENEKGSDEDEEDEEGNNSESDNTVKPPSAKRTKLSSGGNNRSDIVGQLQNTGGGEEERTVGQIVSTSTKARNGVVEHS